MGPRVIGREISESVGEGDIIVGLDLFDRKGSGGHEFPNEIESRPGTQTEIRIGEAPTGTVVDGGEDVGFLVFQGKGDIFDIELKALSWTVEHVATGMWVGFFSSSFSEGDLGSLQDFVDPVGRNREAEFFHVPRQASGAVMKFLPHGENLFSKLSGDGVGMGVGSAGAIEKSLRREVGLLKSMKPIVVGGSTRAELTARQFDILELHPSQQAVKLSSKIGIVEVL